MPDMSKDVVDMPKCEACPTWDSILLRLVTMPSSLSMSTFAFLLPGVKNMMLELVSPEEIMEKLLERSLEPLLTVMLSPTADGISTGMAIPISVWDNVLMPRVAPYHERT